MIDGTFVTIPKLNRIQIVPPVSKLRRYPVEKISKEQIEELAIFAGFRPITHKERYPAISTNHPEVVVGWETPDKNFIVVLPDFPHDLNACFRYFVGAGGMGWIKFHPLGGECHITAHGKGYFGLDSEPATALCLAVLKLIEAGISWINSRIRR
jgi:hypothetical protein